MTLYIRLRKSLQRMHKKLSTFLLMILPTPKHFPLFPDKFLLCRMVFSHQHSNTYKQLLYMRKFQNFPDKSGGFILADSWITYPVLHVGTIQGLILQVLLVRQFYAAKDGVVDEASCGWNYGYGCHVLLIMVVDYQQCMRIWFNAAKCECGSRKSGTTNRI